MGYTQFLIWATQVARWGLGKQKYLYKAWKEATKGGKQVLETQFPKLLSKAKHYYDDFIGFTPKVIKKDKLLDFTVPLRNKQSQEFVTKWNKAIPPEQKKIIIEKLEKLLPEAIKSKKPSNIIPFPKKPPGKADGGRIAKALPTRSRDI